MKRLLVTVLAAIAFVATACGTDSAPQLPAGGAAEEFRSDSVRESAPADPIERKEVLTGRMTLTADHPVDVGRQVVVIVEDAGGRVDSVTEQPEISSLLTVRVPADLLDDVIDDIRPLGRVTNLSTHRDDVTMQYTDLEARLGALRASVDRLRVLLDTATNTADLIEAENALAARQAELDSLEAQRRQLADTVDLSTFTVDIATESRPSDRDSFWDGVVAGWNGLWATLGAAVVALGVALPWMAFLLVGAVLVYLIVRVASRRRPSSGTAGSSQPERTDHDA